MLMLAVSFHSLGCLDVSCARLYPAQDKVTQWGASDMPRQDPRQFLRDTPRGAYTAMYVRDGSLLLDWPMHLERLTRSLKALHTTLNGFYSKYYTWLKVGAEPPFPKTTQFSAVVTGVPSSAPAAEQTGPPPL